MTKPTTLIAYASAFLGSISLFGLVDAARVSEGGSAAGAVTQAFLMPLLGIAAATFLALTIIGVSRRHLRKPYGWNSEKTEQNLLDFGLALTCYFGVLALISYLLALLLPGWVGTAGPATARYWPWFLAVPCLLIGAFGRRNKPVWLAAGAIFATVGIFTG